MIQQLTGDHRHDKEDSARCSDKSQPGQTLAVYVGL